jgi:hypothetical protein
MANKSKPGQQTYKGLSILIQQDGFSFYLHNEDSKTSLKYSEVEAEDIHLPVNIKLFKKELEEIVSFYEIKKTKLVFANELYSLVPEDYYAEEAKADYLKYNVQLLPDDQIIAEYISDIEAYLLFIPLMNYHNVLLEYLEEFDFFHYSQALIKDSRKKALVDKQKLKVIIRKSQLDIIAFDGLGFKMCNTFSFQSDIDIVYYVLFSIEELGFDQSELGLYISHDQTDSDWLDVLKKYVKNVYSHQEDLSLFI